MVTTRRQQRLQKNLSSNPPEEEMNLCVKVIKTIAMKVKKSETIKHLKAMLREKVGVSENLQELFFAGDQLKDGNRIEDYGIPEKSTIHLVLPNSNAVKLYVRTPSNKKTIELQVQDNDTIRKIKSIIQDKEGIKSNVYTLYHAGKLLEDNSTLAMLNKKRISILQMVSNPKDMLTISVETPTKEILRLKVKFLHTIGDVKKLVVNMTNIAIEDWDLFHKGIRLQDCKTLVNYNIKENNFLKMSPAVYQIFMRTWIPETTVLRVKQMDKIGALKHKIFLQTGVPVNKFYIIFSGQRVHYDDDRTLASYNIKSLSTIHVNMKLLSCSNCSEFKKTSSIS